MKLLSAAAFLSLLLTATQIDQQVVIPSEKAHAIIVIRLLNGNNGKPIKHEGLAIVLGDNPQEDFRADSRGELILDLSKSHPRDLRAWMFSYYMDCRSKGDMNVAGAVRYSLDEITSKGIVAENDCGKIHASPTPGVLVLYMRPMTFKERRWL
jgi:hypothetical protein